MTRKSRRRAPSVRWSSEHGFKVVHRFWVSAAWHALEVFVKNRRNFNPRRAARPYACRWGQWYYDGETAPRHWHIGRRPTVWK
jgi:hypothetical protein